jgi:hypothetical protein
MWGRSGKWGLSVGVCALGLTLAATGLWISQKAERDLPGESSASGSAQQLPADLSKACRETADWVLRTQGLGLQVVVRVPFVVAGDGDEAALDRWHGETLGPAAALFATEYFDAPPSQPITVLLLRDRDRYRGQAERILGHVSVSSHGFYRDHLRMMVVNVQSGPGAVLHELVHAMMAFDFPEAPSWLREGLAAIYEEGLIPPSPAGPGRRLPVLLDSIRRGELRTLESLVQAADFDDSRQSVNYAQAQQFCWFLHQQGLLGRVYRQVRDNYPRDPSGEATVRRLLGHRSWAEIDARLRSFIGF